MGAFLEFEELPMVGSWPKSFILIGLIGTLDITVKRH